MRLETERLTLRRWNDADKYPFQLINADTKVMEFYPKTCSAEESDQIIERAEKHFEKHGFGLCAAELKETNSLVGFVGLQVVPFESHFTPAVEIGWRVASEYWGRGLATEGALAVLKFGFEILKLNEIVAMTVPSNTKSRRVMEKLNMNYDPHDDFENPRLPSGHALRPHVLYRLKAPGGIVIINEN